MSSRNWCFTLNNFSIEEETEIFKAFGKLLDEGKLVCAIMGREVGENGTPHLQGFVQFANVRKQKVLKDLMPRSHLEIARGTPLEAWDYCEKDGDFITLGDKPKGQGKRKDLEEIKEMALSGASRREIYLASANYQAFRFGEIGREMSFGKRNWKPLVEWHWGVTGGGKSHYAQEILFKGCNYFKCSVSGVVNGFYFAGYEGQEDIIFEEFRGSSMKFELLLELLDKYDIRVRTIGGSIEFQGRRIVITSSQSPEEAYQHTAEQLAQLMRRIDRVVHYPVAWKPPA